MKEVIKSNNSSMSSSQQTSIKRISEDLKKIKDNPAAYPEVYRKHHSNALASSHHMFDKLLSLNDWWNARTNYTRCTATWTMLGYIFGLGDRHTANIMVQPSSGKVVHIDYEVMLDLGKTLKYA